MNSWSLVVDLVAIAAGITAILSYFGITPNSDSGGSAMPLSRKWKLVIMLGLMAISLGLSGYGFYRSLRPKIVEKTVEIPVDRIVEKLVPVPCPKVPAKKSKESPQTQFCEGGNCAQSNGQTGGITAGVVVDTPPLKISWDAKEVASDKPEFQYAQQVTIRVNTLYTPVSLAVVCDAEVDDMSIYGTIANLGTGIQNKTAFFRFTSPVVSPGEPLVVQIRAKRPFSVKDVQQAKIN